MNGALHRLTAIKYYCYATQLCAAQSHYFCVRPWTLSPAGGLSKQARFYITVRGNHNAVLLPIPAVNIIEPLLLVLTKQHWGLTYYVWGPQRSFTPAGNYSYPYGEGHLIAKLPLDLLGIWWKYVYAKGWK